MKSASLPVVATLALVASLSAGDAPSAPAPAPATAPAPAPAPASAPAPAPAPARANDAFGVGQAVDGAVSRTLRTLRWSAYGELHYNNIQAPAGGSTASNPSRDMLEMHRFVLLGEASLHDDVRLVTEIEIEHGFVQGRGSASNPSDAQGELELEQAFLEWTAPSSLGMPLRVRGGTMLVPISIGNLYHEPTTFHGVERPEFDRVVVPTTWFENGVAVLGDAPGGLSWQAALLTALDGSKFRGSDVLREGRTKGNRSSAEDWMGAARLDWRPRPGLWFSAAGVFGSGDQSTGPKSNYRLGVLETRIEGGGFEFGASGAMGSITAGQDHPGRTATGPLPEAYYGYQAFLAYDVLRPLVRSTQKLFVFVRHELWDTQARVPEGTSKDPAYTGRTNQFGLTWKPYHDIVLKFDYQERRTRNDGLADVWSLGLGFAF